MQQYKFDSLNSAFLGMASEIFQNGSVVSPRGKDTLELQPVMFEITDPTRSLITLKERKHPYRFNIMELIWLLSGSTDPWIIDYLAKWGDYVDLIKGKPTLAGAYGPRLRSDSVDQFRFVVNELRNDRSSRQAIMTISNPIIDTLKYKDFPCTCSLKFVIRNDKLNLTVDMRSNDLVWGMSSDVFNFCAIQCIIASILNVQVGKYNHIANSLHIYSELFSKVKNIIANPTVFDPGVPDLSTVRYSSLDEVYHDASFGKGLKSTGLLPNNDRYLSRLMRYVYNHESRPGFTTEKVA